MKQQTDTAGKRDSVPAASGSKTARRREYRRASSSWRPQVSKPRASDPPPFLTPEDLRRPKIPKAPKLPKFGGHPPLPKDPDVDPASIRVKRESVRPFDEAGTSGRLSGAAGVANSQIVRQRAPSFNPAFDYALLPQGTSWPAVGIGTLAGVVACLLVVWLLRFGF